MSQPLSPDLSITEIRCYFVRKRNCLLVRGTFSPMYMDYYLHLMQHGIKHPDRLDEMLKDGLAGITLYLASRPHDEACAWTVNFHDPLFNLFVAGSNTPGRVTGRLFTEDVKKNGKSLFIAQTSRPNMQPRQSMTEFQGTDVLAAMSHFYTQSEQRPTRLFRLADEDFVQISAEPDADVDWLMALTDDQIADLDQAEQLSLLETRAYVFDCGCTAERMFPMLSRLSDDDLDYIFESGSATITCPRCAAIFRTPKSEFLAWKERQSA